MTSLLETSLFFLTSLQFVLHAFIQIKGYSRQQNRCMLFPVVLQIKIQSYFQGIGDLNLAYQCFKLTLVNNNDYAEAYNNLAVLEMQKGHIEQVGVKSQPKQNASFCPFLLKTHVISLKWRYYMNIQLTITGRKCG